MTGLWSAFGRYAAPLLLAGCAGTPPAPQPAHPPLLLEFMRTSGPATTMQIGNVLKSGKPASFESKEQLGLFGDAAGHRLVLDCDQLARASVFALTKKSETRDFSEAIYYTRQLANFDVGRIWMRCPAPQDI